MVLCRIAAQERRAAPRAGCPDRRRQRRGMLQTGARVWATPGRSLVGAAERDEPCTALPSAGPDQPGARAVGPRLPPVHRRVRDRRPASRESTPRCASLVAELLQAWSVINELDELLVG